MWFWVILGSEKQTQFKANIGIINWLDVKKIEFALPSQTFYVWLAVENLSPVFRFVFFRETGILPAAVLALTRANTQRNEHTVKYNGLETDS